MKWIVCPTPQTVSQICGTCVRKCVLYMHEPVRLQVQTVQLKDRLVSTTSIAALICKQRQDIAGRGLHLFGYCNV